MIYCVPCGKSGPWEGKGQTKLIENLTKSSFAFTVRLEQLEKERKNQKEVIVTQLP